MEVIGKYLVRNATVMILGVSSKISAKRPLLDLNLLYGTWISGWAYRTTAEEARGNLRGQISP